MQNEKTKAIRLIVCDLDGTLLHRNKTISNQTALYLINLQKQGYRLILASGRFFYELAPYIKQLHMEQYHGFAICSNGLEVHDIANHTTHYFDKLSHLEGEVLLQAAQMQHISSYVNINQRYHAVCIPSLHIAAKCSQLLLKPLTPLVSWHFNTTLQAISFQQSLANELPSSLHKICFLSTHHKLEHFRKYILQHYPNRYAFYYVNAHAIEIVVHTVGKRQGVAYVCEQLSLSMEQVLAFGDSGNDEELLAAAGIGVTMKNAFYKTKNKATLLSRKSNEEDGVLDMLKQLLPLC